MKIECCSSSAHCSKSSGNRADRRAEPILFEIAGWLAFAVALLFFIPLYRHSHSMRLHQNYFITYLLLSDEIRDLQKRSFEKWIEKSNATDPQGLCVGAFQAIENVSDKLASGDPSSSSVVGATALIWKRKQGTI